MTRPFLFFTFLLLLAGCVSRPPATDYARTQTHTFEDTANTQLGRVYEQQAQQHHGESAFHIINSGPSALMTRVALAEMAQRSIDLQYFTARDDETGQLLLEAISRAAERGVRVRILLDDWYLDEFAAGASALNTHRNIEVRVFNPYSTSNQSFFTRIFNAPAFLSDYDRRMHNKAFIVDNQVAIMGGRNLGDEYFEAGKQMNLRDIDVFTAGPIVPKLSHSFDRYWNSDEAFPISILNLPSPTKEEIAKANASMQQHWNDMANSPLGKKLNEIPLPQKVKENGVPLIWAPAELAADNPAKTELPMDESFSIPGERIRQLAGNAQHEFILFSPYFVPMDNGVKWLTGLVKRGVKVRIVTNSLSSTDMVAAQAGYGHYRQALLEGGVEIYEIKSIPPKTPGKKMFTPSAQNGLHAKIYMIDRRDLVIGSFNFDPRSVKLNTEQALVIHSAELCEKVTRLFDAVSAPDASYQVMLKSTVPQAEQSGLPGGPLVWKTVEDGKTRYFDHNPHAGFWRRVTDGIFSVLPIEDEL